MWWCGVLGNYLGGVIDVKFGPKPTTYFVTCLIIVSSIMIAFLGSNAVVAAFGVGFFMFSISVCTNLSVSITVTVFGREDFENAWPVISVLQKIIMSSGLIIIALIAAATSYVFAFIMIAAIIVVAIILIRLTPNSDITEEARRAFKTKVTQ